MFRGQRSEGQTSSYSDVLTILRHAGQSKLSLRGVFNVFNTLTPPVKPKQRLLDHQVLHGNVETFCSGFPILAGHTAPTNICQCSWKTLFPTSTSSDLIYPSVLPTTVVPNNSSSRNDHLLETKFPSRHPDQSRGH